MKKAFILLSLLPTMLLAQASEGGEALRSIGRAYEVGNETYKFSIYNEGYASVNNLIGGVYVVNRTLETLAQHLVVGVYPEEGGERIDYFDLGEIALGTQDVAGLNFGYPDLHSLTLPDQPQTLMIGQNYQVRVEDLTTGEFLTDTLILYFRENITIEYTLPESGWGTLCLPFGLYNQPEDLSAYYILDISDDELALINIPLTAWNSPYIVKGTPGATYSFTGPDAPRGLHSPIFTQMTASTEGDIYAPKDSYVLQCNDGITGFYKVQEDNQELVRQYEAYFTPNKECGDFVSFSEVDWTTAIKDIHTHPQASDDQTFQFDLFGRRISNGQRGALKIKDGRVIMSH